MPIYTIGRLKRQEAFCYTYKHNLLYFIIAIEIDLQCVSTTFSSTIVISGPLSIFQALCQYFRLFVNIAKFWCIYVLVRFLVLQRLFRLFVDIAKYWCIHVLVRF